MGRDKVAVISSFATPRAERARNREAFSSAAARVACGKSSPVVRVRLVGCEPPCIKPRDAKIGDAIFFDWGFQSGKLKSMRVSVPLFFLISSSRSAQSVCPEMFIQRLGRSTTSVNTKIKHPMFTPCQLRNPHCFSDACARSDHHHVFIMPYSAAR